MAFNRPDLAALIERAQTDLNTRIAGGDARLRRSLLAVLARLSAAAAHGLYGYIQWLSKQLIYDSAEAEYLARWASIWGVTRLAAAPSSGTLTITGLAGAVVPSGSIWQRPDGVQFATQAEVTLSGTSGSVPVQSVLPGAMTITTTGASLALISPIVGINSTAVVAAGGLAGGADSETDTALRGRFMARIQAPPHGGALHDYVAWAKEVPGVTRVWAFAEWLGIGTVGVLFLRDNDPDPFPGATEIDAVKAHLDPLRPAGKSGLYVASPIQVVQDFTIAIKPNTVAVRADVTAVLADLFRYRADVDNGSGSGTIYISHIREAISLAAGEFDHVVTVPADNIELSAGEIATLGTITFSSL